MEIDEKKVAQLRLTKQFDLGGSVVNQRVDSIGYDYESVMHYPASGIMKAKIEPIDEQTRRMGWYFVNDEDGMSPKDKKKLSDLYCGLSSGKFMHSVSTPKNAALVAKVLCLTLSCKMKTLADSRLY